MNEKEVQYVTLGNMITLDAKNKIVNVCSHLL